MPSFFPLSLTQPFLHNRNVFTVCSFVYFVTLFNSFFQDSMV